MLKKIFKSKKRWLRHSKTKVLEENKNPENREILKMCRGCYSFNYEGDWHFEEPHYMKEAEKGAEVYVQFTKCPACLEELLAQYDLEFA